MRRTPYDKNAPRKPPTAFMLFVKQRRLQSDHIASLSLGERNRVVGLEWSNLPADEKATFVKQAQEQREQYNHLLDEYKKTDSYRAWLASSGNDNKKISDAKRGPKSRKRCLSPKTNMDPASINRIPIFTHEFLEYNKVREVILRQLKKQAIQLEEETALLSKHVDNLVSAETKVKNQLSSVQEQLENDERLLKRLHKELAISLNDVAIPCNPSNASSTEHITETSIESFLSQLVSFHKSQTNLDVVTKAVQALRTAVSKKTLKLFV